MSDSWPERHLNSLYATSSVLQHATSLEEAAPKLLSSICAHLDWLLGEVWQVEAADRDLRWLSAWHDPALDAERFISASRGSTHQSGAGLSGVVWEKGEVMACSDLGAVDSPRAKMVIELGLECALAFPIKSGKNVYGVTVFYLRELPEQQDQLERLLLEIGSRVGDFVKSKQMGGAASREPLYQTLVETIPDVFWFAKTDGQVTFQNKAWHELTGRGPEESLGGRWTEALHPDDAPLLMAKWERAYKYGEPYHGECRFRARDGSYRLFSFIGTPVRDQSGRIINWAGVNTDITDRREAEDRLRESDARNRAILGTIPDLMFMLNQDGVFLDYHAADRDTLLLEPEHFLGRTMREMLPPEVCEKFSVAFELTARTGHPQLVEYPLQITGEDRYFEARALAYEGNKVMVIVRDISDRKRAEKGLIDAHEELEQRVQQRTRQLRGANQDLRAEISERRLMESSLREREERLRLIYDLSTIGIAEVDGKGNFTRFNAAFSEIFGYSTGELEKMTFLDVTHPDDVQVSLDQMKQLKTKKRDFFKLEKRYFQKDGSLVWGRLSVSSIRDSQGGYLRSIAMLEDITERKAAEAEQERMQRDLLQTQKLESLGVLAGGIAHDFNNLLTAIAGYARLAAEQVDGESPARDSLEQIILASDRAAGLTGEILAFSGRASVESQDVNLSEHVRELDRLLSAAISKKVTVQLELSDDLPLIEADPAQIQQVLMNLILNGAESCGDDPGVVVVRTGVLSVSTRKAKQLMTVDEMKPGRYVFLEVRDSGSGMDEETKARIFDPFFTTKFTGRGLGLSSLLGIVRGHGGSLKVDSTLGEGTRFRIFLPASDRTPEVRPEASAMDLSGKGLLLVVDDEPLVSGLAQRILEGYGYEVITAENGRQALEIFDERADEIDLVLLDMTMPEMNGRETLKAMEAIRPDVVAVLSSGYSESDTAGQFSSTGLAGFIQKPYTPRALVAKVKEALGKRGIK